MKGKTILIVEDEEDILQLIRYNLDREGFRTLCAETGEDALRKARADKPDMILLDLMLPGIDGLAVARKLREDRSSRNIPIIMLTAKGEESDIVTGLEIGADDYITKPFSSKVLIARIRAVFRRQDRDAVDPDGEIRIGSLYIDPRTRNVFVNEIRVDLTFTEFQLLLFLVRRPGWVFTRSQIIDAVHGNDYPVTDRSVDVQVVGLRKKLGPIGKLIETVRGVGYRYRELS